MGLEGDRTREHSFLEESAKRVRKLETGGPGMHARMVSNLGKNNGEM